MKSVDVWTDGGQYGSNPGPASAVAVLVYEKNFTKIVGQGLGLRTNNYAESMAVLLALKALKVACNITLYTDSMYVVYGINRVNDPRKKLLKTNKEVWTEIRDRVRASGHKITPVHVDGHNIEVMNIVADAWATKVAADQRGITNFYHTTAEAFKSKPEYEGRY